MIKKKKKRSRIWVYITLLIVINAGLLFFYYQDAIAGYLRTVRALIFKPDVEQALAVVRRMPLGIYCSGDECYVFDADGILFDRARTVVGDVIVKIADVSEAHYLPKVGAAFLEPYQWENLKLIVMFMNQGGLPAQRVVLDRAAEELTVYAAPRGTPVYFTLEFSPAEHLRALKEFQKVMPLERAQYVDMRVEHKIFYK